MSQRWEAAAARYDTEKVRIAAARNALRLTGVESQAVPADPGGEHGPASG
jgi:hypothetical protein